MITSAPDHWDRVVDVVVLGSGAAGLAAATLARDGGSEVLLLEKSDLIGGTTAVSGGMPWIPMNRHMADVGVPDSRQEALEYIRRLTLGREPDAELVEAYVDTAPEMLDYLESKTPLRMTAPPTFSDYYADLPGGKQAGRSIEPAPFDARSELGDWAPRLRTTPHMPSLTMEEGLRFLTGLEPPDTERAAARDRDDVRVLGPALVAALFKGLLDRGVEVETGAAGRELVVLNGEVAGVRVELGSQSRLIGARQGVVLACGGFEWNEEMVKAFIGQVLEPMSPPYNEGDGHVMAMEAGAELANMTSFWGQPALVEPGFDYEGRPLPQMGSARSTPGVLVVNRRGRRFTNEGVTYQDFPKVLGTYDPVAIEYPNQGPIWLVFDHAVKESTVILPSVLPGEPAPQWIIQAATVGELAGRIGVDPHGLEATVAQWNDQVASGTDPDFHRGTVWFEAFSTGGPSPSRCLVPVAAPPFYAVRLHNGTLGTNGGPRIDRHGRVRSYRGGVIPGLYAAGNASACVFGPAYPGGGATIGPALTFGYLAGKHIATRTPRQL
jgi:succinate dehydrogenase/fumarate reductase flavoprotein subunit